MLPPTKDPCPTIASVPEAESASNRDVSSGLGQTQQRTDAVGAEIPVVVHASRYSSAALGIGKNLPPVHEETRTVIVFPDGAVVKVSASIAAGELVVLTNQQTGADVICRVVNVKTQPGIQNYVNLEFTQRAPGFWDASSSSENDRRLESALPVPASLPAPTASPETRQPMPQQAAMLKAILAAPPTKPPADFPFAPAPIVSVEKRRSTAVPSGNLLGIDSSLGEKPHSSSFDATPMQNWARPNDAGVRTTAKLSGSKKILLIASSAVLLLSVGAAGGVLLFRNSRAAGSATPIATNSREQSVPLPPVTSDQDAALPPQQDMAAGSDSLQSAVIASSENGQPNLPSAPADQPAAANSPSEQPNGQPQIAPAPQPARHYDLAVEKLSVPIAKTPVVGNSAEAPPIVADQISGLAGSGVLGDGVSGEAPRVSAPIVPARTGGQIQAAKPLTMPAPVYPLDARTRHIEGVVTIDAELDETGKVVSMKVLSGPPELRQAAMNALRKWKYQPAMLDGHAISSHIQVNLSFHLH